MKMRLFPYAADLILYLKYTKFLARFLQRKDATMKQGFQKPSAMS